MQMNIFEKKALYSFGCPDYHATVDRLHLIAALAPDYETKKLFFNLAVKLSVEETEHWYQCFFRTLRQEMDGYYDAELTMKLAEISTYDLDAPVSVKSREKSKIDDRNALDEECIAGAYSI